MKSVAWRRRRKRHFKPILAKKRFLDVTQYVHLRATTTTYCMQSSPKAAYTYNLLWCVRALIRRQFFPSTLTINTLHTKVLQWRAASGDSYPSVLAAHKKVAHTRLPSVGFRSWYRFLAVSLQVTWVINPAVGCHYFLPGPQLHSQSLRGLLPILLLGEQRHNGCEQFA